VIELRDPPLLLAALAAVPVYLLAKRPAGRLAFSSLSLAPRGRRSLRARLAGLPAALLALAAALFGVALAGPRVPDQTTRVQKKGIAIMLAVDVSGSMRALDLSEGERERTRLDAVKEVLRDFVLGGEGAAGRPDDAIGLVGFARFADCRCPLTLDHRNLVGIAAEVAFAERDEDGTAIGDGLGLALERLRESRAASKVAVLLTDGESNAGELSPLAAAETARALGIRVYTIGAGRDGWAPVRVTDPLSGRSVLRQMPSSVDEETLRAIAERTGGRFFRASDAAALREVYAEIDRLERTDVAETRFLQYDERFEDCVAAALASAALSLLLGSTWLRRAP
jgi:Ca-activated chloride channel family protein